MRRFAAMTAIVLASCSLSGCVLDHTSAEIPWWKGIPAMVLAPNSQEAFGWHNQRHGYTYEQDIRYATGPIPSNPANEQVDDEPTLPPPESP